VLNVWVNKETLMIGRFQGSLPINRGLKVNHVISKHSGINQVIKYIRQNETPDKFNIKNGIHKGVLIYRPFGENSELDPWWEIAIELRKADGPLSHNYYYVDPDKKVSSAYSEGRHH